MTQEQELVLWEEYKAQGSLQAREKLILQYMEFAKSLAVTCGAAYIKCSYDDAISEAYLALIECIDKFDPAKNHTFKAMARQRIRGSVVDHVRATLVGTHKAKHPMDVVPMSALVEDNEQVDFSTGQDLVLNEVISNEESASVGELLLSMPFSERCSLLLRVLEQVPHEDFSTGMGFSKARSAQLTTMVKRRLAMKLEDGTWPWVH